MRGLLADANYEGQLARLLAIIREPEWIPFWIDFGLTVETFASLGLDRETKDRAVWERCQSEGLILITGNRNARGPDSLELTIRDGPPDALPVVTIADGRRVVKDSDYARVVAAALMDVLDAIVTRPETVLGSGRLYIPKNPPPKS